MKKLLLALGAAVAMAGFGSDLSVLKDLCLKASTDKENPIDYKVGENIEFKFRLDGLKELPEGVKTPLYAIWTRTGDDGVVQRGTNEISLAKGFTLNTKLGEPGFVRYRATLTDGEYRRFDKKSVPALPRWSNGIEFDGGAGADTEKMELTTKEPADFDAFWKEAKLKLAAVPVEAKLTDATPEGQKQYKIYGVEVKCFGPRPVTGWLTIPVNAKPESLKAVCQFHGYNGRNFKKPSVPGGGRPGAIVFNVNAHGYEMTGRDEQYYVDYGKAVNPKKEPYALNKDDYDNPKDTYFYYMAMRVMRAFDYVRSLKEWNGKDLEAEGGSQGGLQTMWAAGLVDGLTKARPSITWGCNLGNWHNPGSKLLTRNWGIPNVAGAFYFDSALHAKRVPENCEVTITRLGLGDYTCPPRGVLLSYYLMKCPKKVELVQGSTHGYVPRGENQKWTLKSGMK